MNFLSLKNRALHVLIGSAALLLLTAQDASAYKVSPLHHYLTLTGKGATSSMVITNSHDYPLTVEMTVERRELSGGKVTQDVPADDDFLIFPPQAIIQPGKKQRVQIRYVGDAVDVSELYRLIVVQVPVSLANEGNYHALLPDFKWTGSDGSQNAVLSPADLPLGEEPFIEPGGQRVVSLPRKALGELRTLSSLKITQGKDSKKRSR